MNQSLYPNYCEPALFTYFLEPINAISNISFLISGFFILRLLKKNNVKEEIYYGLCLLITFVGIGSILWHSYKHPITLFLDFLPINLFILTSFYILVKKITGRRISSLITIILFIILQIMLTITLPKDFLNGSYRHLSNSILLFILLLMLDKKYEKIYFNLVPIFLIYITAIIFRSIDLIICPQLPIGTHFIWHILNGVNAYLVVRFLIRLKD